MKTIKIKKSINIYNLLCVLFFIFMLRPIIFLSNNNIELIWKYTTVILSIISVFIVVVKKIKKDTTIWIVMFCISFIIGTLRNEYGNIVSSVSLAAQIVLAFNLGMLIAEGNDESLLKTISLLISIIIIIDSCLGFANVPRSLGFRSDYTLLGYDNYAAYIVFPLLIVKLALDNYMCRKWIFSDYLCVFLSISYKMYTNSINAYFFFVLFIIAYVFFVNSDLLIKLFDFRFITFFSVISVIGVVRFHIEDSIAGILVKLGKTTNLSFRSFFWQKSAKIIPKTPLFGYGVYENGFFQRLLGVKSFIYYSAFTHSHNFFIDLYFFCGIIGTIIYILIVTSSFNDFLLTRKKINKARKIVIIGVAIYYLMGFLDGYASANTIYFLFGIIALFTKEYSNEEVL